MFLANCGNENLQYLLVLQVKPRPVGLGQRGMADRRQRVVPSESKLVDAAHRRSGTQGGRHRQGPPEEARGRAMREANAEAFRREIEEFTANFLNARARPSRSSTRTIGSLS